MSRMLNILQAKIADCDVRALLTVLTDKVLECHEPFDARQLSKCLVGFKGMSSKVRKLLDILHQPIANCRDMLCTG